MSAVTRVRLPRLSPRRLRWPRLRTLLVVAFLLVLLGAGWLWVRGSSLVSVDRVTVVGLRGASSWEIRSALTAAARRMTTLEVNASALERAVSSFPVVKGLSVSTQFPHGLRIRVVEQVAVAAVTVGGRRIAVAADGTLLPSVRASGLASIPVSAAPDGPRLSGGAARDAVAVLAAAPAWLRARVTQVSTTTADGLVAELHAGPQIYFGDASQLRAKWAAAAAVLADPGSQGAAYINVSAPQRPAAGGVVSAASPAQPSPPGSTGVPGSATGTGAVSLPGVTAPPPLG